VPLYDLYARFALRLERYRRYISADLESYYVDDEIFGSGNQHGAVVERF
jgi:hypothetical protein